MLSGTAHLMMWVKGRPCSEMAGDCPEVVVVDSWSVHYIAGDNPHTKQLVVHHDIPDELAQVNRPGPRSTDLERYRWCRELEFTGQDSLQAGSTKTGTLTGRNRPVLEGDKHTGNWLRCPARQAPASHLATDARSRSVGSARCRNRCCV